MKCKKCGIQLDDYTAYEYRGAISCADCFDEVIEDRDRERSEVMNEEHNKTKVFKGLDLTDSPTGQANKKLLKGRIEVASKESLKLKNYEGR